MRTALQEHDFSLPVLQAQRYRFLFVILGAVGEKQCVLPGVESTELVDFLPAQANRVVLEWLDFYDMSKHLEHDEKFYDGQDTFLYDLVDPVLPASGAW